MKIVVAINPGSMSTKIGVFSEKTKLFEVNTPFFMGERPRNVADEFPNRLKIIEETVTRFCRENEVIAIVGRGGPLKPLPGGVYRVNGDMLDDLKNARYSNHASNLGAILADYFARRYSVPALIVDPVTVDEFDPLARISGFPGIERRSRSHALSIRATVRRSCDRHGWKMEKNNFVVAHLGGGISVAAVKKGQIRDVNDGLLGMGPFSPERAGALPIGALTELAASRKQSLEKLQQYLSRDAGLKGYLGTADAVEVETRIARGDEQAELIYEAMLYQIKKEIGAMLAVCNFKVKAVLITGGLANSDRVCRYLKKGLGRRRVEFYPGENELEAMADGAWRALKGEIEIQEYSK